MRMPAYVKSSLLLLLISFFLFSCSSYRRLQEDIYAARDKERQSFVQTTDGKVIEANEAVLRTPLFKRSIIELDKETRIPVRDVVAYQDRDAYYRKIRGQFAPRIKKGSINMYRTTEIYTEYQGPSTFNGGFGGTRSRNKVVYYIQKGDESETLLFTPDVTREYVKDYAPSMDYINMYDETQRKVRKWSWINTGAVIGGAILLVAGVSNSQVSATGYAGAGLFFGGLINGFVNKIRRAGNYKNLELAIDEYNNQGKRIRK
jgi:hypothetical protein